MSRSRLTLAAALALSLAGATLPALAADFPVTITTTGGTRQFTVLDGAGQAPLASLDFGANRSMPYKVRVTDVGVPLLGNDYSVATSMSNLYFTGAGGALDYTTMIPSSSLALDYSPTNPLSAAGLELPVIPEFTVSGSLSCAGLSPVLLSPLATVCTLVGALTGPVTAPVTAPAAQLVDSVDLQAALHDLDLGLDRLPLSLTGGQERGRFTVPASQSAQDPATGAGATSKIVMRGRNLLSGATLNETLTVVNAALATALAGVQVIPTGATPGLLEPGTILDALSGTLPTLTGLIRALPLDDQLAILDGLTATLTPLTSVTGALGGLSGTYTASPVITAAPATTRPGTYTGTMTVDFFQP